MRSAWSPSRKRAQKAIFQPSDQPVPSSPRSSSDFFAASNSSGVRGVISSPGRRPRDATRGGACSRVVLVLQPPGAGRSRPIAPARSRRARPADPPALHRPSAAPPGGGAEQRADDWWSTVGPITRPRSRRLEAADQPVLSDRGRARRRRRARLLHHRIAARAQETAPRELVVPPQVPGAARRPWARCRGWRVDRSGAAPEVGVAVEDPAAGAVLRGGRLPPRRRDRRACEHTRRTREVRDLRGPVVHLGIDVHRYLPPGRRQAVVPAACRLAGCPLRLDAISRYRTGKPARRARGRALVRGRDLVAPQRALRSRRDRARRGEELVIRDVKRAEACARRAARAALALGSAPHASRKLTVGGGRSSSVAESAPLPRSDRP